MCAKVVMSIMHIIEFNYNISLTTIKYLQFTEEFHFLCNLNLIE